MDYLFLNLDPWLITFLFTVIMALSWVSGWWLERKLQTRLAKDPGVKFTDATMALLGLLLGFTFSMSLGRHENRRMAVVTESNPIGDFHTCVSLLQEPHRSSLQEVTRAYAEERLALSRETNLTETDLQRAFRKNQEMYQTMTERVRTALTAGTTINQPLTNTLNALISSAATRKDAYRDRIPSSILILLIFSSAIPAFLMGRQQGGSTSLHLAGPLCFVSLVSLVIYVTLDLNQPSRGSIRVSQEPMESLVESLTN